MARPIELMAPAGDFMALSAALRAGADAVYFGVGNHNMRAHAAANFKENDLKKIVSLCKAAKVKSYLTINTLVYDGEYESVRALCRRAKAEGVSAIIAADPAVIMYARELGLEVHMSVQANVANVEAVRFWARYADVMVLARELTLPQIQTITRAIETENILGPFGKPVRIEIFAHGALCVAVSGKCYMSLALNGESTSANRGRCQQPCRRLYTITDAETEDQLVIQEQYVMSPKDICTVEVLDQILESGVSVLKIEGRGRSPDYVGTVTGVYRDAIRAWQTGNFRAEAAQKHWMETLEKVFNRGFWKGGYYLGKKLGEWCQNGGSMAKEYKEHVGDITQYFSKIGVAECCVRASEFKVGDELWIIGNTTGALRCTVKGIRVGDDGIPSEIAHKGDIVSFEVPVKVRKKDNVYVIKTR